MHQGKEVNVGLCMSCTATTLVFMFACGMHRCAFRDALVVVVCFERP
jgi:hypothetical protein